MVLRALLVIHRWIGVVLCLLFFLWFASGIGMMYFGMPMVTARDRLERAPALDPDKIVLSPQEAAAALGIEATPAQVRLSTFDGRPAYRVAGEVVYADTGEVQGDASLLLRNRAAAAWTGQPAHLATVETVGEPDQWLVGSNLRTLRPLWKYSWPNGEQLYIGTSGEVLQYTTPSSRLAAYVSAIPHWLYFTSLRKHQPVWIRIATYSAFVGTAGAIVGLIIGLWLYSPSRKYRYNGAPSRVPYRGWKRWHTIFGLVFGVATITWTFSGSLAFLPFPSPQPARPAAQAQRTRPPAQAPGGRRPSGAALAAALRGRTSLDDFSHAHPREVVKRVGMPVKEVELTSFAGEPLYNLRLADGTTRLVTLDGRPLDGFDTETIIDIVKRTVPAPDAVDVRLMERYNADYLDRRRELPLPVLQARLHDADNTRFYIDPRTATVVGTASDRNFWRRWLYNGLHSLNFPWLYDHRPLWDIVVITFMLGGMALSLTSFVLAWRAVGRKIRRTFASRTAEGVISRKLKVGSMEVGADL